MNPRVKELAEQAGGVVLAGSEIQKFAELIVRECVGMLDDEDDYGYESRGVRNAAYRIKKRFGVEE